MTFEDGAFIELSGGRMSGFFEGVDRLDEFGNPGTDGFIKGGIFGFTEITGFTIHLEGNSLFNDAPSFSTTFNPFILDDFLRYDIRSQSLGIFLLFGSLGYGPDPSSGLGFIELNSSPQSGATGNYEFTLIPDENLITNDLISVSLNTNEQFVVSQVPLPGALLFFASGLGGLGVFLRLGRKAV